MRKREKINAIKLHSGIALTVCIIAIVLSLSGFATALKMQSLPLAFFPWLIGILLAYCLLTQLIKNWFINKFNQWL